MKKSKCKKKPRKIQKPYKTDNISFKQALEIVKKVKEEHGI